MKINRILLHNIRSHKDNEIKFEDGINVIVGRTGAGKSSILMAIEYALFGSSAFQNSMIMRRNSRNAKIELEFEKDGHNYKIIRGLKKSGKSITVDIDNMRIYVDGKQMNLLGRKSDIDGMVKRILGYPEDVKGKELFEITTYTRQDEIRKIIEMKPEERQEYIDRILQLAKYKLTADNLRGVIKYFENEKKSKEELIKFGENIEEEIAKIEDNIGETENKINELNEKIGEWENKYKVISSAVEKLELEYKKMISQKLKKNKITGELNAIEKEISNLNEKISEINKKLEKKVEEPKLEEAQMKLAQLVQLEKATEEEIRKIKRELTKVENLEGGVCPICKQEVGSEHVDKIRVEYGKQISDLEDELKKIEKDIMIARENVENQKELKRKFEEQKRLETNLSEHIERINKLNERKSELENELKEIKEVNTNEIENKLKDKRDKKEKILAELNSMKRELSIMKNGLNEMKEELKKKKEIAKQIENEKNKVEKIENLLNLLNRLREDIKNMREIVRRNYLEEFRRVFRKRFEEIRRDETEYTVDIKSDYEPIAYANGVEVKITNLSGGEKTSVALAYKLALSELASMASAVIPTRLLILDEPTTGLDPEDVKALADAIKNISHIPQVIIVTHDETLKGYADHVLTVEKSGGESRIA